MSVRNDTPAASRLRAPTLVPARVCNPAQTHLHVAGTVEGIVTRLTTSQAAVVVPAPANLRLDQLAAPPVAGTSFRGSGLHQAFSRALSTLGGFGGVIAFAYAFPLVILAVGIPVALFARLVAETVKALWPL